MNVVLLAHNRNWSRHGHHFLKENLALSQQQLSATFSKCGMFYVSLAKYRLEFNFSNLLQYLLGKITVEITVGIKTYVKSKAKCRVCTYLDPLNTVICKISAFDEK